MRREKTRKLKVFNLTILISIILLAGITFQTAFSLFNRLDIENTSTVLTQVESIDNSEDIENFNNFENNDLKNNLNLETFSQNNHTVNVYKVIYDKENNTHTIEQDLSNSYLVSTNSGGGVTEYSATMNETGMLYSKINEGFKFTGFYKNYDSAFQFDPENEDLQPYSDFLVCDFDEENDYYYSEIELNNVTNVYAVYLVESSPYAEYSSVTLTSWYRFNVLTGWSHAVCNANYGGAITVKLSKPTWMGGAVIADYTTYNSKTDANRDYWFDLSVYTSHDGWKFCGWHSVGPSSNIIDHLSLYWKRNLYSSDPNVSFCVPQKNNYKYVACFEWIGKTITAHSCYNNGTTYIQDDSTSGTVKLYQPERNNGTNYGTTASLTLLSTQWINNGELTQNEDIALPFYVFAKEEGSGEFMGFYSAFDSTGGKGTAYGKGTYDSGEQGWRLTLDHTNYAYNNAHYYAIFKYEPKYSYTIKKSGNGINNISILVNGVAPPESPTSNYVGSFTPGTVIKITANVNTDMGYVFDYWECLGNAPDSYNANKNQNVFEFTTKVGTCILTAFAKLDTFSLSVVATNMDSADVFFYDGGVVSISSTNNMTWAASEMLAVSETRVIYAKPDNGYTFVGWYRNYDYDYIDNIYIYTDPFKLASECNVTKIAGEDVWHTVSEEMPAYEVVYYAAFIKNYTVTVQAEEGVSVSGGTGSFTYYYGQELSMKVGTQTQSVFNVTVQNGYQWDNWSVISGDIPSDFLLAGFFIGDVYKQDKNLTMPSNNFTIKAKAIKLSYGLTVISAYTTNGEYIFSGNTTTGGTVKIGSGTAGGKATASVTYGGTASITASVSSGYEFMGWYKTISSSGYSNALAGSGATRTTEQMLPPSGTPVGQNYQTYYAVFIKKYTLTLQSGTGISNVIGAGTYIYGQNVSINATVNTGYSWDKWSYVSGTLSTFTASSKSQQIEIGAENVTLKANATANKYTLTVHARYTTNGTYQNGGGGTVKINSRTAGIGDNFQIDFNSTATITATPSNGYKFMGWHKTVTSSGYSNPLNPSSLESQTLTTEAMTTSGLTYYAIFIKEYQYDMRADEGVQSHSPMGIKMFYYGQEVSLTATVKTGYIWEKWLVVSGTSPNNFNPNTQNQTIKVGAGNCVLKATIYADLHTLTVNEMTEGTNGNYSKSTAGGTVTDGKVAFGTVLTTLINPLPTGFEFGGFFTNSGLTTAYTQTTMPNNDLTLYAKFSRISYTLTTASKYANVTDNNSLTSGNTGGSISAVGTLKYDCTTTLTATAVNGFVLHGIYKTNVTKIQGNSPWKTGAQCNKSGNVYTVTSEKMGTGGLTYYAVFKRAEYNVNIEQGTGTNLTVSDLVSGKAYFGQSISITASLKANYNSLIVKVLKTDSGELLQSYNAGFSFTMKAYAVTFKSEATANLYTLTFNPNGGTFSSTTYPNAINGSGYILGSVSYLLTDYSYYLNLLKTASQAGVPTPSRTGYKLKGWNTTSAGSGTYYITYSGTTPTFVTWNKTSDTTLFAVWEIVNPDITLTKHISGNSFTYNGANNNVFTVSVNNFISGKTYSYSWYKTPNILIVKNNTSASSNTLQLRSTDQTGSYYCRIEIIGETVSTQTATSAITINKKALSVSMGEHSVVGNYSIALTSSDLTGLVANHQLKSGFLSFVDTGTTKVYTAPSSSEIIIKHSIENVTSQDGQDLLSNYNITYTGSVTVKSRADYVYLSVGNYEAKAQNFESGNYGTQILTNVNFSMTFGSGFISETAYNSDGTQSNYIDRLTLPKTLTLTFLNIPQNYKVYKVCINNEIDFTLTEGANIKAEISLIATMLSKDSEGFYYVNIKVYLTKEALVYYNYGFETSEVSEGYASFDGTLSRTLINNSTFIAPTAPTRKGFGFGGWYYDQNFSNPIGTYWLKIGIVTIYAKWNLLTPATNNVSILVYDNGVLTEQHTRNYNANSMTLGYSLSTYNKYINYNVQWYKNGGGTSTPNIKNVSDSETYSLSIALSYKTQSTNYSMGKSAVTITINEAPVTITNDITKTYDGTTSFTEIYLISGVGGEQLKLTGKYSSPDVNKVSSISLTNLGLESYSGSNPNNYSISNLNYSGKITPRDYTFNKNDQKVYDGNKYSKVYDENVVLTVETQVLTFTVQTSGANCGTYKVNLTNSISIINFSVKNSSGQLISIDNYNMIISPTAYVEITKAEIINVVYKDYPTVFDNQNHLMLIENNAGIPYSGILPIGAESVKYFYNNAQTTGFTNAGEYLITAKIKGNGNYEDKELTATLKIEKAKLSFVFKKSGIVLDNNQYKFEYTGIDIYNDITITTTNGSGTVVIPVIEKYITTKQGVKVTSLINVGEYIIKANFDTTNYEVASGSSNVQNLTIITKIYKVGTDIILTNTSLVYGGINLVETYLISKLTLPEGVIRTGFSITQNGSSQSMAKNVGTYNILVTLAVTDTTCWGLDRNSIEGVLTITKFEITNLNSSITATKKYDGKNSLPTNAIIQINLSHAEETLKISGTYANVNVGTNININNFGLVDNSPYLKSNYSIVSNFASKGKIEKQQISIKLFKETNKFLPVRYTGNTVEFSLTKDFKNLVTGMANNEYITVKFKTLNSKKGEYNYSSTASTGMYCVLVGDYAVYSSADNPITNGKNNYDITVTGGIEILVFLTNIQVIGFENAFYNGLDRSFNLKLNTNDIINYNTIEKEVTYVYSGSSGYFKDIVTNEQLDIDTLKLSIKLNNISVSKIKTVGIYTLTFISIDNTYIFTETEQNQISVQVEIKKAPIEFGLGNNEEVDYNEVLTFDIEFTGQNNEKFYLNVIYNTGFLNLDVGEYFFADYLTIEDNFVLKSESTAKFSNYEIMMTGKFKINPKEIIATNVYSDLTYSGQNQINAVTSISNKFTDNGTSKTLVRDTDYWFAIKQNHSEVFEMISAGTYAAVLSSKNYKFAGGSTEGEFNIVSFNIEINKAELKISLYDNKTGNIFARKQFRNEQVIFYIDKNNQSYIIGTVNSEYITVSFKTLGSAANNYPFSKTANSGNFTKQLDDIKVFNSGGQEIQGGAENYEITIEGGIKIVYVITTIKLVNDNNVPLPNLTYTGHEVEIRLELRTDRSALGKNELIEYCVFLYEHNCFEDAYFNRISTERLNLVLKIGNVLQDYLKNAGNYTLTVTSQNNDYIFSETPPVNEYETSVTIAKAKITFGLEEREIDYGSNFETIEGQNFYGQNNEYFNVTFNSDLTKELNVVGSPYNISNYVKLEHCIIDKINSTAKEENYIISITGILNVIPREITVSKNYNELEFIYTGKNRYDEINDFKLEFKDKKSSQILLLKLGTDYTKSISTTEIIKAGTYTVTLSSQNYKFSGDNTSTESSFNKILYEIKINKAELTISLYDDTGSNIFVQKPQTTNQISVEINVFNNSKYTSGRVNGEYIEAKFSTYVTSGEHIIGNYPYNPNHNSQQNNMTCFKDGNYIIYDKDGFEIVNGENNYNITVLGGIEIVESITEVEFWNLSDLVYNGEILEIKLRLTTNNEDILELVYDYVNSVFRKDDNTPISQEQLTLHINDSIANSTNLLKDAETYTLKLISSGDTAYVFGTIGTSSNFYTETIEIASAPIGFDLKNNQKVDYSEILTFNINFTGQNNEKFYLSVSYNTNDKNLNIGEYSFADYLIIGTNITNKSESTAKFSNYEITLSGTFKVLPKEITATNVYSNLTYSGQNQIETVTDIENQFTGANKAVVRDTDFWLVIKQNHSEVFEMISAGTYVAVLSSKNYKFVGGSTEGEFNIVSFNIKINKKALTISLYDNKTENIFARKQFRNEQIIFNIDKTNNSYVFGAVNSEYIIVSFKTLGSAIGDYQFSKTESSGNYTKQLDDLKVFNSGDKEIQGGAENYEITIEGGIEIVYVLTTVEFSVEDYLIEDLTYKGSEFLIRLKLYTNKWALGGGLEIENFNFIYNLTGNYFKDADTNEEISTEKLGLILNLDNLPQDFLKQAGNYTLILTSQNNDYIFNTNSPVNEYETNVTIAKAEVIFDLEEREITYGSKFIATNEIFDGVGGEKFNVTFNSNLTKTLNVNGSPYDIPDYVKLEHCIIDKDSSAKERNYIISIDGILNVTPREITVSRNYNELELIYSGKNQFNSINDFALEFKDAESSQILLLKLGTDYTKSISTTEIINAGTYTVTLSSQNYKFSGNNTSTESSFNKILFYIEINKAELTISLYDDIESKIFVQKPFRNINITFDILKDNNSKYVFDMVNGEYLTASFITNGKEEGLYSWEDEKITYQNIMVFDKNNIKIDNGKENYDITILGGIEIVEILTDVNFIWQNDPLIYSGLRVEIQITLKTLNTINGNKYIIQTLNYDYENSVFRTYDNSEIPENELSLNINGSQASSTNFLKNANEYTLEIISSDYTYVFDKITNNSIVIGQASIIFDLSNQTIIYGDEFIFKNINGFIGKNEDIFFVEIKSEYTKDKDEYQVGSYQVSTFLNKNDITVLETGTQDLLINYDVSFAGTLIVNARLITVEAEYLDLIYNKDNKIPELNNVEITFKDEKSGVVLDLVRGERDYEISYLNYAGIVNKIINVGNYSVILSSKNYWFEGSTSNGSFYELKFAFQVNPKEISVEFTIEKNLVYNNELKNPVSCEFIGVCAGDENLLNKTLLYSNNQEYVINAGIYTASVTINNSNYYLAESISDQFEIARYEIIVESPTEIYFSKYYGTDDPDLTYEFIYFQEPVLITFKREVGENVGTYSLTQPVLGFDKNETLILNNYEIGNYGSFVDTFKAFEILAYTGDAGYLTIKQTRDIEIVYDSLERSFISFDDYKTYFSVYNYEDIKLNSSQYQLVAELKFFELASVKNVGEYSLILGEATSSSHLGEISFINNEFIFKILQKELIIEKNSNVLKQYDKTSEAFVSESLSLIGVENADLALVVLKGKYVNEFLEEQVNVNVNYFIYLMLSGDEKDNYYIKSDYVKYFKGNIIPRKITVVSVSDKAEDFDKEYDKTSVVEIQNLKLNNTIAGDEVDFSGNYKLNDGNVYVVGDYKIEFLTLNSNYNIVKVNDMDYTGSITERKLLVSKDSILTKVYDGFATLNTENITFERKIEGDDVELTNAEFSKSAIGVWDIIFTLGGDDSSNYYVEDCQGEITEQTIIIKLNYGDDADIYQFDFVDGNSKTIDYIVSEFLVFFGRQINDEKNGGVSLPTATREGYEHTGWYLTPEFETIIFSSTKIDEPAFVLAEIMANNETLNLFAKWEKNEYQISIEVQTENNEIYEVSTVGGHYSIGSETYDESRKTFDFNYYDLLTFEFLCNSYYEVEGLYENNNLLTSLTSVDFRVIETTTLIIKFVRESYIVTIEMGVNLTDIEISGIPSDWMSFENTLQKSVKYSDSVNLPNFVRQGYYFTGYSTIENDEIIGNTSIIVYGPGLKFYANWQAKTYKLYFNYLDGEETETYVFEDEDDFGLFIFVEFDKKIGELPQLSKQGYIHNNWILTVNNILIGTDYDAETIWKTDGETEFVLKAVWLKDDNIFSVSNSLNTDIYVEKNLQNYNIYKDNIIRIDYFINEISYGYFTEDFLAKTEDVVQFNVNMLTGYYVFEAWYIGDIKLNKIGSQTIDEVIYETNGEILIISGFLWGLDCPDIEAVYTPFEVEVEISDFESVRGSVDIDSGTYLQDDKIYTLTGAKIFMSYIVNKGYELIDIIALDATITQESINSIMLTDFNDNLIITFNFEKQSYLLSIECIGSIIGVENIELDINNAGFEVYNNPVTIETEDIIIIRVIVKKGYTIIGWEIVGSDEAILGPDVTYNDELYTISERKLSEFKNELSILVELENKTYSVTTNCMILNNDILTPDEEQQNKSYVLDKDGQVITSAKFLDNVTYMAECYFEDFVFQSQNVTAQKFEFVGWHIVYSDDFSGTVDYSDAVRVSTEKEFLVSLDLDDNIHYTAVFELKMFEALFVINDYNQGVITGTDSEDFANPQEIRFGENLSISIQVTAKKGYRFTGWKVTYIFVDVEIIDEDTFDTAIIQPTDITNVRCNIIFEAMFKELEIYITAETVFVDETLNINNKVCVTNGDLEGPEISFSSETNKTFMIKAFAKLPGYEFDGWDISSEEFLLISDISIFREDNTYSIGGQLEIKFVGDDSDYIITAKFKQHNNMIITTLLLEGNPHGGIVTAEDGTHSGPILTSYAKTENSLINFVYFHHGYHLDMSTIWEELDVYSIETETIELTKELSKIYSLCLKLTITGFASNTNITIKADRDITTIHFYKLNEFDNWIESSVTGTIKYGTRDIVLSNLDMSFLSPTSETHHFLGWSTEIDIFDIYINPNGELNFNEWRIAEEHIDLFEFWELKRVKLDVEVIPENATILSNYYIELFDNLLNFNPTKEYKNGICYYYFDIGAEFGISIPRVVQKYTFKEYQVLQPNGAGGFEWTTLPRVSDADKYEYSTDLFKINSYNNFVYSMANQSGEDITDLVDGTMYVKLIFGIGLNIITKNYYSDNITAIGGNAFINEESRSSGIFEVGEEINITAVPDEGYLFKYWIIDGEEFTETIKQVIIHEDLSIEAIFIGKHVKVEFGSSEQGNADEISGGNIEIISNVEFYHVGDKIFIGATPNIGYQFSNVWYHKATETKFIDNNYVITAQDSTTQLVELTPVFEEKLISIQFSIEGSVFIDWSNNNIVYSILWGEKIKYSFSLSYFTELNLTMKANERYKFTSIKLVQGTSELDVSDLYLDNVFSFNCNQFGDVDELIFNLYFEKAYWYDYVIEKEFVKIEGDEIIVLKDLSGTGRASDPYKIYNMEAFALWAYLVNNKVQQTDGSKMPYNSEMTHYIVDAEVIFSARFWTPIGTKGNEFNGTVNIYYNRIGIFVDDEDSNYPIKVVFDMAVLEEWGGLFGALSDTAKIIFIERDYFWYFVIAGAVIIGIVLISSITRIIHNKRKSLISSIDNNPPSDL